MPAEISGLADEALVVAALQRVNERNVAYSLIASDGVSERIFYFAIGGIRVIRSGVRRSSSVGEVLIETGKLSQEQANRAAAEAKATGTMFGEACVSLGFVEQAVLDEALRLKVQDELLDLFLWDGAEIHLQEGQPPKAFYEGRFEAARISCAVPDFLKSVLAVVEQWRSVLGRLPGGREVLEATDQVRAQHKGTEKGRLLGLLDGTRTLTDAMNRAGIRRVTAYEFLLELLREGKVRRVPAVAAQKVSREELAREVEALEDALKVNADARIVRNRLARALEAAGDNARAASQWRFLGDRHRRENVIDKALECYREAVRVVPTDFSTRELILEIHRHKRDYGALIADGRPLAELFLKHNLLNRAKHLLLQLVGMDGDDPSLRRQLVMVLIGLSERDLALKHLRELARLLEQRHAPAAELRDVYVRILALDKKDAFARDRLDTITGAKFQRRILRMTLGTTAVALAVLGCWFLYEGAARRSVNGAIETARRQVEAHDYVAARATLQKSLESFRHSRASGTAYNVLRQIEEFEREERERRGVAASPGTTSGQRASDQATVLERRSRELLDAGKTDDAYRSYRELFELYGDQPIVESVTLPLRVSVVPAEARVLLAGEEKGQGALVLTYSPHAKCTLVVEHPGYVPFKRMLDGPQEGSLDVWLEKPTRWSYAEDAAIESAPLVTASHVVVAGRDRRLTALSRVDGAVQWRTPLGYYDDVAVRPVETSEGIFVATASGDGVCVNAATGEVLWRRPMGAPVERQPVAAGRSSLLVAANDGSLRALDARDGTARWVLPAGAAAASPVALPDDQMAYVDGKGGLVFASVSTGQPLPGYAQPAVLRGVPVGEPDRLWVMAEDSSLRVISTATRRAVKRLPVPAAADVTPAVAGDVSFAVSTDGTLHATRVTGDTVFRVKLDEVASASPCVAGGRVYVPGCKGHVHVLDAATGELLWRFDAKSRVTATPVVKDGTVYVVTSGGRLFAVEE